MNWCFPSHFAAVVFRILQHEIFLSTRLSSRDCGVVNSSTVAVLEDSLPDSLNEREKVLAQVKIICVLVGQTPPTRISSTIIPAVARI